MNKKLPKLPIILYEEQSNDGKTNAIPYIEVGKEEEMPTVLFISEYKETGEFEPDPQYGSRPIVDMIIHKYVDFDHLKNKLDSKTFDKIRIALGMQPLKQAKKDGKKILNKVYQNAETNKNILETNHDAYNTRVFKIGENLKNKMSELLKQQKSEEE